MPRRHILVTIERIFEPDGGIPPLLWNGKTMDTELRLDLHNVLPSPYLRDLIDLQLTLSDEENGFAEGGAPEPERLLDGSLHPI